MFEITVLRRMNGLVVDDVWRLGKNSPDLVS